MNDDRLKDVNLEGTNHAESNREGTDSSKSDGKGKVLKILIIVGVVIFLLYGCGCVSYLIYDAYLQIQRQTSVTSYTPTPSPSPAPPVSKKLDEKTFPDEAFRKYLAEQFDVNGNGVLECSEYEDVTEIHVNGLGIESLEGIGWFRYLNVLECRDNHLTSLDLSHNTRLLSLDCSNNSLSKVDVSNCKRIEEVVADPDVEIIRP